MMIDPRIDYNAADREKKLSFAVGKAAWLYTVRHVAASPTAEALKIDNLSQLNYDLYLNACALAGEVLEPLAIHFQSSPLITSWFRCKELNLKAKGAATSDHLRASAVDFTIPDKRAKDVFNWLAFKSKLRFDQLIWEYDGAWVHVSFERDAKNARQIFGINNKGAYPITKEMR